MPLDQRYPVTEFEALARRFEIISINDLLVREGIKLKTKAELSELKKKKNADFSLCFEPIDDVQEIIDREKDLARGVDIM